MKLRLYLARQMALTILGAGGVLMILALGLDLIDTATDLIESGGWRAVATYAILRLPLIGVTVLPIAVLTGGSIAFLALAARSELVVLRASGLNTLRLLLMLLPLSILLGIGYGLLSDRIAAIAERELVETFPNLVGTPTDRTFWARAPEEIVRIGSASPQGRKLENVSIFALASDGTILTRTDAEEARYVGSGWNLLGKVMVTRLDGGRFEGGDFWRTRLVPSDVVTLATRPEFIGANSAAAVLAGIAYGARGVSFYETRLWRAFAAAAVPAIMLTFAAAAGFGLSRAGGRTWLAVAGLAAGFLFIAADGFLLSLGASGTIDARVAVFTAPVLFGALGLWGIVLLEE